MLCNNFLFFISPLLFMILSRPKSTRDPATNTAQDTALFLTPYIESGRIVEAQRLAKVRPMLNTALSFSGYLTVNKKFNSNLFFWLVTSQEAKWEDRPLVIWLQGGVGETSLYGFLRNIGPFSVTQSHKLKRRKYTWSRKYNILFIDQPVGSGFSFTENQSGYATNFFEAAEDLYEALVQLYKLFPVLRTNPLVIAGESSGTLFAMASAHKIFKMNKISPYKVNFQKLILASHGGDPTNTAKKYSPYLFNLGLFDKRQEEEFSREEEDYELDIKSGDYLAASKESSLIDDHIVKVTGLKSFLTVIDAEREDLKPASTWYLNQTDLKTNLHLGNHNVSDGKEANARIKANMYKSDKKLLEELLEAGVFRILFTNGQLDFIAPYLNSVELYESLDWSHASEYHKAKRCQFRSGTEVAGYYKTAGTLTEVMIRNSGHLIASAKPKWAFDIIDRFITNSSYFECL